MKIFRAVILAAAILLPCALFAQQVSDFDSLFGKYCGKPGVGSGKVNKVMLMAARAAGQGDKIPEGLNGMKSLMVEERSKLPQGMADALERDIRTVVGSQNYTLLSETEKEGYTIKAYTQPCTNKMKILNPIIFVTGGAIISVTLLSGELPKNDRFIQELTKQR